MTWVCLRYGVLCGLLVVVAVLACRPFGEIGYVDDWSTARTAQIFAQNGHFTYNGWMTATEGWQILWAALFVKLFGFSYFIVRVSLLPIVFATVFLFYQSLIRFGFTIEHASFGALALGLSPLFLPTASSFMTDIPSLMVTILCLVLCQKAVSQREDRAFIFWLAVAALADMLGGTVRQTAFLGVLLMIPAIGWWQRKRPRVWRAALVITVVGSVWVFLFLRWFDSQPYAVPLPILVPLNAVTLAHLMGQLFGALFFLLIGVLPVLAYFLPWFLRLNRTVFWGIYVSIACLALITTKTVNSSFVGLVLRKFRIDLSFSFTAVALAGVALLFIILRTVSSRHVDEERNVLVPHLQKTKSWHHIFWLLGPYCLGYLLLLLQRGAAGWIWDRYLLGLTPVAIVGVMKVYQDRIDRGTPKVAIISLALLAGFGVAKADRRYSENRAILKAANILRGENIPRTKFSAGFEYDCETQLDATGYVNEPNLKVPADAYHPYIPPAGLPMDLANSHTPSIVPEYFILDAPNANLARSKYPPVRYTTLLPPFRRTISIQQLSTK
jgi:hypothetical protein